MSSEAGPTLAHRSVTNIRATPGPSQSTPQTPPRNAPSAFGSPSALRAEDDVVIIELGSRYVRVGFAGDSSPKVRLSCGPEEQRRAGDFRSWQNQGQRDTCAWSADHELWRHDLRDLDLGLVEDKIDRLLRDAFTKYLLIDSRPRRAGLVLDSGVPIPLLSVVLNILFNRYQTPTISLMSSSVVTGVAAGVRSALVVDMGWAETVITSTYEYREVKSTRTIRGGRFLLDELYQALQKLIQPDADGNNRVISFAECEDIMCRLIWCRPSAAKASQRQSAQLETVEEQDESETEAHHPAQPRGSAKIPLRSSAKPSTLEVPFDKLADICDASLFPPADSAATFDDNELPVHLLLYQHLLQLPVDVRAVCMSRIIFTGGCSNILGVKERIIDEVASLVDRGGWEPVTGKALDQLRSNAKIQWQGRRPRSAGLQTMPSETEDDGVVKEGAAYTVPEKDPIGVKVARRRNDTKPPVQGKLRAIHSLGPWAGGSLLCQLKVPALATIDRELWLQHGVGGASRPSEVDVKAQQRQSMGTGGPHPNFIQASSFLQSSPSFPPVESSKHPGHEPPSLAAPPTMNRTISTCTRCRAAAPRPSPPLRRGYADAKRPVFAARPIVDIKHIRQNPELYEQTCLERNYGAQAGHPRRILELHAERQQLQRDGRSLREKANLLRRQLANPATSSDDQDLRDVKLMSRDSIQEEARELKVQLSGIERRDSAAVAQIEALALELPNLTSDDTPRGSEPRLLSYINDRPGFAAVAAAEDKDNDMLWRSHVHIGSELGILDFAGAATAAGWGWYYLVGEAAQLEQALVQYALAVATRHGWTQVSPPSMVYSHIGAACGFQPRDQHGEQQVYTIAQHPDDVARGVPEMCLAGTSEIPLAGMKANTTIDAADLPLKRVAVSRCYRAEAGARGADTKGLYRVHEFTKVELFAWTDPAPDAADDVFDEILDMQTEILSSLGLYCRVLAMPSTDLGASAVRKVDMEAWFPSRRHKGDGWGEVSSASLCTDYQSRRLVTRLRGGASGQITFPWTANGTALAVPRVLAALLENGWDEESMTVTIPECLRPWMDGKDKIGLRNGRSNREGV
ncbi:hypothetical protein S40288_00661 [Stachybotrys chartarum IBT 40288]|nr:hypothetical protein S40288_00661 [Stachybotrys chartarum IBT 40288]